MLTFNAKWEPNNVPADAASVSIGVYDDTAAVQVVAPGTTAGITKPSTGNYAYSYSGTAGHTYTATFTITGTNGAVGVFEQSAAEQTASPASNYFTSYGDLQAELAFHLYAKRGSFTLSANQSADIDRCIRKGLHAVYSAYTRWSFLRPVVTIQTLPTYNTGTITVVASTGVVTLVDGTFPSYAATSFGQIWISTHADPHYNGGLYQIASRDSDTQVTLANYTGPDFATVIPYVLSFNRYPLPLGFDTFEDDLTFQNDGRYGRHSIPKVDEIEVRRRLQHPHHPGRPDMYALTMAQYTGVTQPASTRYITFWPIPDAEYVLSAKASLRPFPISPTVPYPMGDEVLAPCLVESCLAAAERDVQSMDANHPEAVHSRAFPPLLAAAVQADKERDAPNVIGVDRGADEGGQGGHFRGSGILLHKGFGGLDADQWIG